MTPPSLDTLVSYATICFSILGALLAALWLSLIIWTFRDMRARSRDPFAQLLAALVVGALPGVGLLVYLILRPPETLTEAYERALEEEALLQEIEDRPACPGCSRTVDRLWLLCPYCHTRLRKVCPDCNSLMELQWNICPYCGNQHFDPYQISPPVVAVEESPQTYIEAALSGDHDDFARPLPGETENEPPPYADLDDVTRPLSAETESEPAAQLLASATSPFETEDEE